MHRRIRCHCLRHRQMAGTAFLGAGSAYQGPLLHSSKHLCAACLQLTIRCWNSWWADWAQAGLVTAGLATESASPHRAPWLAPQVDGWYSVLGDRVFMQGCSPAQFRASPRSLSLQMSIATPWGDSLGAFCCMLKPCSDRVGTAREDVLTPCLLGITSAS